MSDEKCKYCGKKMKFIEDNLDSPLRDEDKYYYECVNKECDKNPKLIYHVCCNCGGEWEEWK